MTCLNLMIKTNVAEPMRIVWLGRGEDGERGTRICISGAGCEIVMGELSGVMLVGAEGCVSRAVGAALRAGLPQAHESESKCH